MAFIGLTVLGFSLASMMGGAAERDWTQEYSEAYRSDCAFGASHLEMLRRYKVLLVPGYFSDIDPLYFSDQARWLAMNGVDHLMVQVRSRQSVAINSPIIARAISESTKPVILITHSKGSADALDAMRSSTSVKGRVAGWISLQGAFFGSPVADMLLDETRLNPLISTLVLEFFGGTRQSAQNLTTAASLAYYRDNKPAIDDVIRDVPAVAFASALDGASGAQVSTTLQIPFELMRRQGIRSDGLVPLDSAVLPGMAFVKVSGVDHIAPVMPAVQAYDRIRMTKALLLLLAPFRDIGRPGGC
jgi:hypothetical protein